MIPHRKNGTHAMIGLCAVLAWLLVSAFASAQTAEQRQIEVCEQTIRYTSVPPAHDVPEHAKGFWGVWVGRIGNFCNALIVTSVAADATARGVYAWGAWGYGSNPGRRSFAGRISGNTLEILWSPGPKVSYSRSGDTAYPMYFSEQGFRNRGEVKRR